MIPNKSKPFSEEKVLVKKEQSKNINKIGLIVLVVIFSLALFLTYQAVSNNKNNTSTSGDVTSPTGKIISPTTGSVIYGNKVTISVEASDDQSGVKSVEIFYKTKGLWQKLTTLNSAPYIYEWDVSNLPVQSVTLDIHVTDNDGNILNTNSNGWQEDIVIIPNSTP